MAIYKINKTKIKESKNILKTEYERFKSNKTTFENSYICANGEPSLQSMRYELKKLYEEINKSYVSIDKWLNDYIDGYDKKENRLKNLAEGINIFIGKTTTGIAQGANSLVNFLEKASEHIENENKKYDESKSDINSIMTPEYNESNDINIKSNNEEYIDLPLINEAMKMFEKSNSVYIDDKMLSFDSKKVKRSYISGELDEYRSYEFYNGIVLIKDRETNLIKSIFYELNDEMILLENEIIKSFISCNISIEDISWVYKTDDKIIIRANNYNYIYEKNGKSLYAITQTKNGYTYYYDEKLNLIKTDGKSFITIGDDTYYFNSNGEIIRHEGKKDISIFDDKNDIIRQYGGNQMDFKYKDEDMLENQNVMNILKENFPNASEEDYILFFHKLCNTGCSYVGLVNTIFRCFEGREEDFKNTFGFPMYSIDNFGNKDFNYEPLIVEEYIYLWKDFYNYNSIEKIYGNIAEVEVGDQSITNVTSTGAAGAGYDRMEKIAKYFSNKYGLNFSTECIRDFNIERLHELYEIYGSGYIIIVSEGYDLYSIDEKSGERGEVCSEDGGSHAMVLTGFTPNGDIIVSSWGNKYIIDCLSDYRYLTITKFGG